jgi:hypothetical protein
MPWLIALLQANNMLEPLIMQAINALRGASGKTDEEVIADARAKVAETAKITAEDMSDRP